MILRSLLQLWMKPKTWGEQAVEIDDADCLEISKWYFQFLLSVKICHKKF